MKNSYKILLALSTLGVIGAGSLAFAQTADTTSVNTTSINSNSQSHPTPTEFANLTDAQKSVLQQAKTLFDAGKGSEAKTLLDNAGIKMPPRGDHGGRGDHGNMKAVDDAIIAGDYTAFKAAAANGPLANISQDVFNSLKAPVAVKQSAETQIQTILKNAGVEMPTRGQAPANSTATNK